MLIFIKPFNHFDILYNENILKSSTDYKKDKIIKNPNTIKQALIKSVSAQTVDKVPNRKSGLQIILYTCNQTILLQKQIKR